MASGSPELSAASHSQAGYSPQERARIPIFVSIVQGFLFVIHLVIYFTWTFFWTPAESSHTAELRITLAILSVSFVAATLLAHRFFNPLVRAVYTAASVWLGFVNFFFLPPAPRGSFTSLRSCLAFIWTSALSLRCVSASACWPESPQW